MSQFQNAVAKIKAAPAWAKVAAVLGLAVGSYEVSQHQADVLGPPKVNSASQLATFEEGKPVSLTFKVEGGVKHGPNTVLLNSMKNYKDPACITVKANETQVPDPKALIGKTVFITGTKSKYNGKDQIQVDKIEIK